MLIRTLFAVACIALLLPAPAAAQIYVWRDANGNLVLSNRTLDGSARTYAVPDAPTFRSTRPVPSRAAREQFEPLVREHARQQGLPAELVRAVIQVESGFNPRARSPKGAMGLMQLMPATARELGVRDPYDPAENVRGGTAYLRQLLDRYEGNEELALAAYNAGSGAVDRHGGLPPFQETRDYVRKVGSASQAERAPSDTRSRRVFYKSLEIIDGQPVPRYSTEPPASGTYEVIQR